MERKKRKDNLVIIGVPEEEDKNQIREYCSNLLMEVTDEENIKFQIWGRIGKRGERARHIRICVED